MQEGITPFKCQESVKHLGRAASPSEICRGEEKTLRMSV